MEPAEPVRLFLTWGEAPQAQAPGQAPPNKPGALGEGDAVSPSEGHAAVPQDHPLRGLDIMSCTNRGCCRTAGCRDAPWSIRAQSIEVQRMHERASLQVRRFFMFCNIPSPAMRNSRLAFIIIKKFLWRFG